MTGEILDFVVAQMSNHQALLVDLSARLEPHINDLTDEWSRVFISTTALVPFSDDERAQSQPGNLAHWCFGELRQGHMRQALAHWSEWNRNLARLGLPFDLTIRLGREFQHALLDFVIRVYTDDPQLPLALDAVDDLFSGLITLIGAVYAASVTLPPNNTAMPEQVSETRWKQLINPLILGHLTEGMAHALNNLFAIVLGHSQLMLEHVQDFQIRDEVAEIQSAALTAAQVIRRIQDFARAGGDARQITDVNALLRDASEITRFVWRDRAEWQGILINVVKDFAEVPPVFVNPGELRRAFVAILLNAIEALPQGGLITLRTERIDNQVVSSIIDNGIGMRGDVRMNALQSFFTTKESPHLGLGLTIVADIIADHAGTLSINSPVDHGTTVNVSVPVAQELSENKEDSTMPSHRPANVLVIDNEPQVRALLARLLKLQGHTVVTAEGGSEGVAAFKASPFDAVLTDLGMPEMSGWDVAREIKKLDPHVLVALTTGWPIEMTPEELKTKYIDRIVHKPFDLPLLFSLIDDAAALHNKS